MADQMNNELHVLLVMMQNRFDAIDTQFEGMRQASDRRHSDNVSRLDQTVTQLAQINGKVNLAHQRLESLEGFEKWVREEIGSIRQRAHELTNTLMKNARNWFNSAIPDEDHEKQPLTIKTLRWHVLLAGSCITGTYLVLKTLGLLK